MEGFIANLERLGAKIWILESSGSKCNFGEKLGSKYDFENFWD